MTDVEINEVLTRKFGRNLSGLPLYRVSWSDSQTETRKRKYNKFSPGGIFLGEIREIAECKKYPTIKERWLLEKWVPPDPCYTDVVVSARIQGSYECVYIFQDADRIYLPLNLKVAEIIISNLFAPEKLTGIDEYDEYKAQIDEQKAADEDVGKLYEEIKSRDGIPDSRIISARKIQD